MTLESALLAGMAALSGVILYLEKRNITLRNELNTDITTLIDEFRKSVNAITAEHRAEREELHSSFRAERDELREQNRQISQQFTIVLMQLAGLPEDETNAT